MRKHYLPLGHSHSFDQKGRQPGRAKDKPISTIIQSARLVLLSSELKMTHCGGHLALAELTA